MQHHPDDRSLVALTEDVVAIPEPVREALQLEPGDCFVLTHAYGGTVQLTTLS
jgi:hypothetical protein